MSQDVLEFGHTAKQAVSAGQLLTAIEVARDGLARFGSDKMLQQQLALALAQTGALDAAREVLGDLLKEPEAAKDEETLSLLGRVYKEVWRRATNAEAGIEALRQSCKYYGDAFALKESYYPGINLAFTLAALGQLDEARACAAKVEKYCRIELGQTLEKPDGWLMATLAEALTHQGSTTEAARYYKQAVEKFPGRWRDQASMRRQAREIVGFYSKKREDSRHSWYDVASIKRRVKEVLGQSEQGLEWLDRCFQFPSVVVFSGHMIDQAERGAARFPAEREAAVRDEIRDQLKKIKPGFGYSSAACGADIIFCEVLLELEAKVNLVLPCPVDTFKRQSVSFAGSPWEQRFHNILAHANTCVIASPADFGSAETDPASTMGLVYANRVVTGLAVLQAQALDFELKALAVWDGAPATRPGGTGDVVAEWAQRELTPYIIHPTGAPATVPVPLKPVPKVSVLTSEADGVKIRHEIKAMLFAEVINHKKIGERQMPVFIREFKAALAKVIAGLPGAAPVVAESWGKSLYFVFDGLPDAANFALEVRDAILRTSWAEHGLPADLGVRMVLHAGPVFAFMDPVLKRETCVGAHVNRAARIEPITAPGQVYASQEFAALCSAEDLAAVSFEFLGRLRTARLFEDAPLYRLDRRRKNGAA
jgi:tetratricopeptide (TPR) repeat protein